MTVRAGVDGSGGAGSGAPTHTGNLTANQLVIGNAVDDLKVLGTLGTATTLLHGNASGAPTFAAASLTADVTGTLPVANGGTGITSLGTGVATFLGTPSSANLLAAVTGATGTGAAVFGTSPTFTTSLITPIITITQGTITSNAPQIDGTVTWNNVNILGPAWQLNVTATSANANADLVLLNVAGVQKWGVSRTGAVTQAGGINAGGSISTTVGGLSFPGNITMTSPGSVLSWGDLDLYRQAANHFSQRSGTNAQRFSVSNTYTSTTNFEDLALDWITTANLARIMTRKGSGGGTARSMALGTDSTNRITIDALGNVAMNGENAAMATTATDGYLSIPTCAGAPTGVPTAKTGAVQLHYDITNDKLWVYNGGWKSPKTPAAAAVITWQ